MLKNPKQRIEHSQSKQKILMITVRSDIGGGPRHLLDLCREIKQSNKNIEITIAAPSAGVFWSKYQIFADHCLDIPYRRFSCFSLIGILFYCWKNSIDIIHSHGRGGGLYSRILALFGFKVVHTFHGVGSEQGIIDYIKTQLDILLKNLPQAFIHVSSDEYNEALRKKISCPRRSYVISNGVNISRIQEQFNSLTKEEARQKFNLPKDKIIWGTLARLVYQKGIDSLLDLYLPPNIIFAIAGDGNDFESLTKRIDHKNIKNIIFLGETLQPIHFLKCLDGYFSVARWEGLPISVLEAMTCGLPCILSDVKGHREFREKAILFNSNDSQSLSQAILSVDYRMRGKDAQEYINRKYSSESMCRKTLDVYFHL